MLTAEDLLWMSFQKIISDLPNGWEIHISRKADKPNGLLVVNLKSCFGHNSTRSASLIDLSEEIKNTIEYAIEQNEVHLRKTK